MSKAPRLFTYKPQTFQSQALLSPASSRPPRLRQWGCPCLFDLPRNSGAGPQTQAKKPSPRTLAFGARAHPHCLTPVTLSPGHTPLHVAVIHKDAEMVRLLREAGADLNKPVSCPREKVWQGRLSPRAGQGLPDLSAAPHRSPLVAGAPYTWQWRPKPPMCWSSS